MSLKIKCKCKISVSSATLRKVVLLSYCYINQLVKIFSGLGIAFYAI